MSSIYLFYLSSSLILSMLYYFNIVSPLFSAFSSMVEGKNRVSTDKLSGGARIHYIFQSIFVKSLEVCKKHQLYILS